MKQSKPGDKAAENAQLAGNPEYSASDDIYNQDKKITFNEEKLHQAPGKKPEPAADDELDVPGAELDDADEMTGGEDEENNYYSIGGDGHNDLDENAGE